MANIVNQNPLKYVGSSNTSLRNSAGAYLPSGVQRFKITTVLWENSGANGDTFQVTDGAASNPTTLCHGTAVTADIGVPQTFNLNREVMDLMVPQLSSGTLWIYLDPLD